MKYFNPKYKKYLLIISIIYIFLITWLVKKDFEVDKNYENRPALRIVIEPNEIKIPAK